MTNNEGRKIIQSSESRDEFSFKSASSVKDSHGYATKISKWRYWVSRKYQQDRTETTGTATVDANELSYKHLFLWLFSCEENSNLLTIFFLLFFSVSFSQKFKSERTCLELDRDYSVIWNHMIINFVHSVILHKYKYFCCSLAGYIKCVLCVVR